jgi:DNA-binding protein H-NS
MRRDLKKMEKSIVKKVAKKMEKEKSKLAKKLEKAFRETRNMIAEIAPVRDKYKQMIINMELITDGHLLDAWDHLQEIGAKKNNFGQFVVPHRFHETFSGNYFKFLVFQQEYKHGMVPNDAEHK